jgi:formate hydrogenlyase transcriptional activator
MQLLQQYDWPGNVRELQNIIERAVIASSAPELSIDPSWLARADLSGEPDGRSWAAQERRRILEALRATGGRIYGPSGAAQRLGLRPTTLYGKMRKHGITKSPSSWD